MSDLRIGLVAEGKTDLIIIEAALKSILANHSFTLTLLQPETSAPFGAAGQHGGGWGGVYRWCRQLVSMRETIGGNPSLQTFGLILLHIDADVAGQRYQDANIENGRTDLPCQRPCPPATNSANSLRQVLCHWLDLPGVTEIPAHWVFCIPSMCSESWLISALFSSSTPSIMDNIECNPDLEIWLSQRPAREVKLIRSGKKQTSSYRTVAPRLTVAWTAVCNHCSQAHRFDDEVRAALA